MLMLTRKSVFRLAAIAAAVLAAQSFAALPEVRITTRQEPLSKNGGSCPNGWTAATNTHIFDYVQMTKIEIRDPGNVGNNLTRENKPDSIRLRGNSTADAAKKPYRIKFGEKKSLFGKAEAKSWVLLANFYDGTFALNAMAFEMGKKMGLEYTNTSQLVDLWINNQYKGIYQLTEQIQANDNRVNLKEKHNGWLAEFDYHAPASDECKQAFIADPKSQCTPSQQNNWCQGQNQNSGSNYNITAFIKSPALDDTSFTNNKPLKNSMADTALLQFVKNDINNLVNKMKAGDFPNNGYRNLIDLESFAKYVLIQMVLDNFDFNSKTQAGGLPGSNFLYRRDSSAASKIKAGPLWDFDLAAGVRNDGGGMGGWYPGMGGGGNTKAFPEHYQTYQDSIWPNNGNSSHIFYYRLWQDPVFKARYKKLWLKHKSDFQALSSLIDNIKSQAEGSVTGNGTNTWANNSMMGSGTLTTQQFNTEVSGLKKWLSDRIGYVDGKINGSGIDVNWDIPDPVVTPTPPNPPTSVASVNGAKSLSGLSVVKNGLRINASSSASVKVVSLTGGVVRRQDFAAGSHTVSLGNLPRGMYLVNVKLDGVKQTVKMSVR